MRKQKPFLRSRIMKPNNNNSNNVVNNNTVNLATSTMHNMATTAGAMSNDYLLSDGGGGNNISKISGGQNQRDRLTEGLHNITKNIIQQRGGGAGGGPLDRYNDDIPLRPLLLNGNSQNANQSRSNE